ncbi:hypothetical protein DER46DRAFT_579764 [Fusarium sp. MPI-SDFR-AT-0072]|nr:hypothetical protein DER46DRAFT_579764 [Fusarium sp. MPI-SDFR-AT-0072]
MYREMASKGGVSEKQFSECYPIFWNWSNNLVEDSLYGTRKHPYFDDYWRSKIPALNKIECPTYIICSWDDHGIHTRGALNAWREISSKEKYLEIHQDQKHFYSHLLLSIIPPAPDSHTQTIKTIKLAVVATRIPGDADEVHGNMNRKIASQVPTLRNYIQVVGIPGPTVELIAHYMFPMFGPKGEMYTS